MTGRTIALWSMVVVAAAIVVLLVSTAVSRAVRLRRRGRRLHLRDELRPVVVAVLSDPAAAPPTHVDLRGQREELFEVLAFEYLAKVKGESRDALVRLLVDRGTIDAAERRLHRPGVVGRAAAAELLGRCGLARSRVPLQRLLQHRSADLRAVGVRALGRLADAAAIEPLLDSASGDRAVPATIVAQSALRVGPTAIPSLQNVVGNPDDAVRSVAVAVLGLLRAIAAVPAIIGVLACDGVVAVRGHAARALGHIGDPRAVDPLIGAAHGDPAISGIAAAALGELGDPRGVEALTTLVSDPRHDVATAAAVALTRCGEPGLAGLRHLHAEGGPAADHAAAAIARAELASRQALPPKWAPRR